MSAPLPPARVAPPSAGQLAAQLQSLVLANAEREAPLVEILHGLNDLYGHVPPASVPLLAEALNLTRAEVHGVVTFYAWFRGTPPGRHVLRLCRGEACQAVGGAQLEAAVVATLGLAMNATSDDGRLTLEPVYCLGNCACGPSALLDGEVLGRLAAETLLQRIAGLA
jgi:formate dehydrogenase subunit gamma